jgi:hypothetical protein
LDFNNDNNANRRIEIAGGLPSKIVRVTTDSSGMDFFVSVGSPIPALGVDELDAEVLIVDPLTPTLNFYYLWWREVLNYLRKL